MTEYKYYGARGNVKLSDWEVKNLNKIIKKQGKCATQVVELASEYIENSEHSDEYKSSYGLCYYIAVHYDNLGCNACPYCDNTDAV